MVLNFKKGTLELLEEPDGVVVVFENGSRAKFKSVVFTKALTPVCAFRAYLSDDEYVIMSVDGRQISFLKRGRATEEELSESKGIVQSLAREGDLAKERRKVKLEHSLFQGF